ncbi:phosphatidylserine decarboxylase proenzyme, mitochondrial isoform X2 [Planococcus citri]|uniref:phosphatidylserine decarboxylase proenzyme, mitochondrial isoform X2 n=1 Tax=Planococcus citri TaxID=170843 RepID=UPI0031F7DF77
MIFKRYQSSNNDRTIQGTSAGWRRWRRLWRGWIVIPTGIGVSVFTVLQWRRQSWNNQPQSTNSTKNFQITCYRAIPLRAMSRAWGWISSQHVPLSIRCWLYTGYARMYGVNLEEAAHSLEHYNSLCEFFIRQLKEGVRPVAEYEPLVSPADGSIVNAGIVKSCNVEQIKGVTYTIKTFLGEPTWNDLGRLKEKGEDDDATQVQLVSTGGGSLRSQGDRDHRPLYDESRRTPSKLLRLRHKNNDAVMNNVDNGGCELLHLGLNDAYQCNNKISAEIKNDYRVLGWLVFYFQFCIKDLLINSFYIGFQIIYGIKSSIVLSNGKILKGASFLRSQLSFGNGTSRYNTRIDASTDTGLTYSTDCTTDCNDSASSDDDIDENKCYDPDWNEYKKRLLHNEDNELYQFVVYLAPGDYHRFHSPADLKIKFRRHFQGELLSVHPKIAQLIPELFSLNERAVYVGEWKHGFFSMVAVGATNVGSIKVHSDKDLLTNTRRWKHGPRFKDKELDVEWKKGEEVGEFRLGSTIVLLFEAPKNFHFDVKPDQKIRVGEPVTSFITEDGVFS